MIDSVESMIAAIRKAGIIPFFKNTIPGWSIEEMTDPGSWFTSSDNLGPWDWKIDVVRTGDIVYGKFLGNKAAFATLEWYRHVITIRRAMPYYRLALRDKDYKPKNKMDRLWESLSPLALDIIKENGTTDSTTIRTLLKEKKQTVDALLYFLEMGTWTVVGDFSRVYRGPNLEYKGWQKAALTTPESIYPELFEAPETKASESTAAPSWAKHLDEAFGLPKDGPKAAALSPEEARKALIDHVVSICGEEYLPKIQKLF